MGIAASVGIDKDTNVNANIWPVENVCCGWLAMSSKAQGLGAVIGLQHTVCISVLLLPHCFLALSDSKESPFQVGVLQNLYPGIHIAYLHIEGASPSPPPVPAPLTSILVTHTCAFVACLVCSQGRLIIHRMICGNGHVAKHTLLVFWYLLTIKNKHLDAMGRGFWNKQSISLTSSI